MRYGMNPHQKARIVAGEGPAIVNGEPSMINYLDALNAFELVREADRATGRPAAASFKHVSPAGAALAGSIDATTAAAWRVGVADAGSLLSAYVRARDADPKSSYGDVVAVSRPIDVVTAEFLRSVISDAVIAPGFEPGAVEILRSKRAGRYLIMESDPTRVPPALERRDVLGVTIEQERDAVPVESVLPDDGRLDAGTRIDALLGMVTLRYTQSNSVALVRDGTTIGVGAGQQNRVDCVRLAAAKARVWWLRRHPFVTGLAAPDGMARQERLNWQIRFAGREMPPAVRRDFAAGFGPEAISRYDDPEWRDRWLSGWSGVTMVSDGSLPFLDNVDHAATAGVSTIVEPGGSPRSADIRRYAADHGIADIQTGLRLFHH